jgi:hypothetical protein
MAGGKETPRQKMIGMMYLVLTALLALNVSKEIINAFVKLDQKLMESNSLLINQSDEIMMEFENAMMIKTNKPSVKPVYDKAIIVREMTYEIDRFINIDCKNELIKSVESVDWIVEDEKNLRFKTRNPMEIETKDDYDAATRLFGGEEGTDGYEKGAEIRERIHQYRDKLLAFISEGVYEGKKYKFDPSKIDQTDSLTISKSLEDELKRGVFKDDREKVRAIYKILTLPEKLTDNEETVAWQLGTFDHAPVVAASAMFTAISNDIRNAEMKALELLRSKISPDFVKVNKVEILASARTNYINMGDSLELNVMMAAYDTTDIPLIKYGVDEDSENESKWKEIRGKINLDGMQSGTHKVKGVMGIKEKGVLKWKPWEFAYEVGKPMAAIENTEMNILYAVYENKMKISASGYPQDRISVSASSGVNVIRQGEIYILKPELTLNGREVSITVTGKSEDGKTKSLGSYKYKVRRLPAPALMVNTTKAELGKISKSDLLTGTLTASYGPEFPMPVRFVVSGFDLVIEQRGIFKPFTSLTNTTSNNQKEVIRAMSSGQYVTLKNVKVRGPGGFVTLPSYSLQIQ